jgi:hypothetical protein
MVSPDVETSFEGVRSMKRAHRGYYRLVTALVFSLIALPSAALGQQFTSEDSPPISVSSHDGAVAWGLSPGLYYWDGASYTSQYAPTTSVSLYDGEIAWGSESGVYYWDGASYTQVDGYTLTSGFSLAPGFIPTGEYSPTTSVSLYDGEIAWGSEAGVYYWNGISIRRISDFDVDTRGDVNGDGVLDLADVVLALKALARIDASRIFRQADVNGDGKIGMSESLYVFDSVAGLRPEP